jgi:hypothetical protein
VNHAHEDQIVLQHLVRLARQPGDVDRHRSQEAQRIVLLDDFDVSIRGRAPDGAGQQEHRDGTAAKFWKTSSG